MTQLPRPYLALPVSRFTQPVQTALRAGQTIGEALDAVRQRQISDRITYFYVVDGDDKLVGVMPTRRLLLAQPEQSVEQFMVTPVTSVESNTPLHRVLELFHDHRFLALPVVDRDHKLVGTIDVGVFVEEAYEMTDRPGDVFQMVGVHLGEMREASPIRGFRLRMPWLTVNILGGILCALIATMYEQVLDNIVVLAAFIPLVLSLSESISIQSMTISLQQLHAPGVDWPRVRRQAAKESVTAALLALGCALAVGVASLFWGDGAGPPSVIAASIVGAMSLAAMLGMYVPVLLHALKLDPRIAAGPVVLMLVDTSALALYLTLATVLLL